MVRARRGSSADLWVATAVYDRGFGMSGGRAVVTFLHTGNPTGLKFLVEHGDARCLFDFGREHAPGRTLFSLGLEPRHGRELADLLAAGAAPPLEGVYAGDAWDGRTHLFITHMHLDHTGLIPFLGPGVPLYYPAAMEPVRAAADSAGYLPWRHPTGSGVADGETIAVGPVRVRFVAVDHDVPGASGFLIETPEASLGFTGDHRWHGLRPELTEAFADAAPGVDLRPPAGSFWIQSGGAPMGTYDPAYAVLEAWTARFGLELQTIMSSGHSHPEDVVRMVSTVHPKVVLPVHSRAPEALVVPGVPSFLPKAGVAYRVADILAGVRPAPSG